MSSLLAVVDVPDWLLPLQRTSPEELLLEVLIQLIVIIAAARVFAALARRVGQPGVVGEIAAGLILGPSVLGHFLPQVSQAIFHPGLPHVDPALADATLNWVFTMLSQLGLIFLLFLIGLEFDFAHLRDHRAASVAISLSGVALPFALGLGLAPLLHPYVEHHPAHPDAPVPLLGFALFLGTALSITAIPILGRILMELNVTRTRLGSITISAAAVDDATGWILLAAVAALARGQFEPASVLTMLAETIGYSLVLIFAARPLLHRWARWAVARGGGSLKLNDLALVICVLFASAIVTNKIGIFAIFGAFLLGGVMSAVPEFRAAVTARLRDLVTVFFLPIFFTYTGLRTNVGSLQSGSLWLWCGVVLAAALLGKLGGCTVAARLTGFSGRESLCIGAMMNTRALMELIVINVGYELGVIPPSVFCMLVLMALVTTVMTTPLLLRLMHGTELEPYVLRSGFLARGGRTEGDDLDCEVQTAE